MYDTCIYIYLCIWYWVHGSACLLSYIDSFLLKASLRSGSGWDQSTPNIASHLEGKNGSLSFDPLATTVVRTFSNFGTCDVKLQACQIQISLYGCIAVVIAKLERTNLQDWNDKKRAATGTDGLVKVARLCRWIRQKMLGIQFLNQRTWQELETPLKAGPSLLAYPTHAGWQEIGSHWAFTPHFHSR